jgi:hypothetical protein
MKTVVIHAGLPKTGSTALQVFLARNHAALRAQSFDYFRLGEFNEGNAGKISSGNGFLIARSLLPAGDPSLTENPASHLAALTRAIAASPCETGILSSEYFAHADPARLLDWAESLRAAGHRVRLTYFIRDQVQALSSMYVQYVKRSHCRETPEAYVARTYRDIPYLSHASFYQTQCGVFGAENIICETYEAALAAPGGIGACFLGMIGADPSAMPCETETCNTGLNPAELAIMRELNKFRPHTRISDQLMENARQAGHAQAGETYAFLPPDLCREIETYFAAGNAELARVCFGRETLFPAGRLINAPVAIGDVSQTDIINVLGGLLVRYDERLAALERERATTRAAPFKRLIRKLAPAALTAILSSRH